MIASINGHIDAARLCLERGADVFRADDQGANPYHGAETEGHAEMAAWLAVVQSMGWKRYLSVPRYELVVLRELAARGRARRQRAFFGKERALDLLFPAAARRSTRSNRRQSHLPDELFCIIMRYYWGGEP